MNEILDFSLRKVAQNQEYIIRRKAIPAFTGMMILYFLIHNSYSRSSFIIHNY